MTESFCLTCVILHTPRLLRRNWPSFQTSSMKRPQSAPHLKSEALTWWPVRSISMVSSFIVMFSVLAGYLFYRTSPYQTTRLQTRPDPFPWFRTLLRLLDVTVDKRMYMYTCTCGTALCGRALCLEYRVSWVRVPARFF